MVSTHMGYGFAFAYFLSLPLGIAFFPWNSSEISSFSVYFVLAGLAGGVLPDIDRWEQIGFSHRKTLHYVTGYGLLVIILIGLVYVLPRSLTVWIVGSSCFFAGAWLHSIMDILDGFWADDVNKGVYEHLTKRWIRALNRIPFASLQEWSVQSFSTVLVIAIAPQLTAFAVIPGWLVAMSSFFVTWLFSTAYEFRETVPKRWQMENRAFHKMALQSRNATRSQTR
jgi:hypothetical protein